MLICALFHYAMKIFWYFSLFCALLSWSWFSCVALYSAALWNFFVILRCTLFRSALKNVLVFHFSLWLCFALLGCAWLDCAWLNFAALRNIHFTFCRFLFFASLILVTLGYTLMCSASLRSDNIYIFRYFYYAMLCVAPFRFVLLYSAPLCLVLVTEKISLILHFFYFTSIKLRFVSLGSA